MNSSNPKFETPILFLVFNRPALTQRVFEEIKKVKPTKFFIAADGPRPNKPNEAQLCEETRAITNEINWDCELKLLFREKNLGCGLGVSQAITWFFSQVEYGIILEDDCLPHQDFFLYCENLLKKFNNDERVMLICGTNYQNGRKYTNASYYFSSMPDMWGWASWKYVWGKYDYNLSNISVIKMLIALIRAFKFSVLPVIYFLRQFILMKHHLIDAWAYIFFLIIWKERGISIMPEVNLVTNIGIGPDSTHTGIEAIGWSVPLYEKTILPLIHNQNFEINRKADKYFFNKYLINMFLVRKINKLTIKFRKKTR